LGDSFYIKVRTNSLLGPIFNDAIDDRQDHLERLTDFWESILFIKNNFEGNSINVHQKVDVKNNGLIEARHFGIWLNLCYETLDTYYEGESSPSSKTQST
jgi:hemoglobin